MAQTTVPSEPDQHSSLALYGRHLVLGISGGIAGYKAADLSRKLQKAGATVQVVMSEAATRFVTPVTFQALTGRPVFSDQWDPRFGNNMAHIDLSRGADAILIAPASADLIAKLALGLADELLPLLCLARQCPLLLAPAMNLQMWLAPATQRHVEQLRRDGVIVLGPGNGDQACGETGDGRMLEAEELLEETIAFFQPKVLAGKRVLITAGPTFEPIDPVRGISNLSSGKMGFAIARAARHAGAHVCLVAGPTALATPAGVQRQNVQTAQQMFDAVMGLLGVNNGSVIGSEADGSKTGHSKAVGSKASGSMPARARGKSNLLSFDVFIAVAAVADWRVANYSEQKIKKAGTKMAPQLSFALNPDILASVAQLPQPPYCVGFAAESENLAGNAADKRKRKGIPLLVANIGHQTFGRDDNELLLVDAKGSSRLPRASKSILAQQLIDTIAQRIGS